MPDDTIVAEKFSPAPQLRSRGFWSEAWLRFRRRKLAMTALVYVCILAFIALLAPAIAGTKPVVCKYKGRIYFPALGYLNRSWENPVFQRDRFRKRYPKNLKEKDPRQLGHLAARLPGSIPARTRR